MIREGRKERGGEGKHCSYSLSLHKYAFSDLRVPYKCHGKGKGQSAKCLDAILHGGTAHLWHNHVVSLTQLSSKWVTTVPGLTPLTSNTNTTRLSSWRYLYGGHLLTVAGNKGLSPCAMLEGCVLSTGMVGESSLVPCFGGGALTEVRGEGRCVEQGDKVGACGDVDMYRQTNLIPITCLPGLCS